MRQAILTKYLGPTPFRGGRIKAICDAKSRTVPYDHALSAEKNHEAAAEGLAEQLGWDGPHRWVVGGAPASSGFAYVFVCKPGDWI